jgi:hypothetical protein
VVETIVVVAEVAVLTGVLVDAGSTMGIEVELATAELMEEELDEVAGFFVEKRKVVGVVFATDSEETVTHDVTGLQAKTGAAASATRLKTDCFIFVDCSKRWLIKMCPRNFASNAIGYLYRYQRKRTNVTVVETHYVERTYQKLVYRE